MISEQSAPCFLHMFCLWHWRIDDEGMHFTVYLLAH